jgi:hypothetical protein
MSEVEVINMNSPDIPLNEEKEEENVTEKVKEKSKVFNPEKIKLINAIKNYEKRWEYLVQYERQELEELDVEELKKILNEHQFNVSSVNSTKISRDGFFMMSNIVEYVGCRFTPLKLQGLTSVLASNQTVLDTIDEVTMKYGSLLHVEPEYRLCYLVMAAALGVHNVNSQKTIVEDHFKSPVNQETMKKFNDL